MSAPHAAPPPAEETPGWGARAAGWASAFVAWMEVDRRRAVLVAGLLGTLLVAGGGGVAWWLSLPPVEEVVAPVVDLTTALAALDANKLNDARAAAYQLPPIDDLPQEEWGAKSFVLGVATALEADASGDTRERKLLFTVAARYLEESHKLGFPPGRRGQGTYWLGRGLYESNQYPHSIPVLQEAWRENPQRRTELHSLLAGALARDSNPRLPEAIQENERYLADKMLTPAERADGLVQRIEILLRQRDLTPIRAALDELAATKERVPMRHILEGQWTLAQAATESGDNVATLCQQAIQSLREGLAAGGPGAPSARPAHYLLGVAYRQMGDARAALVQFARTRKLYTGEPEELAAMWAEAELLEAEHRDKAATELYLEALAKAGSPDHFSNPWLTLDELRRGILAAYARYLAAEKFPAAIQIATALTPLHPAWRSVKLVAEAQAAWASDILTRSEEAPGPEAAARAIAARTHFRAAGESYGKLAQLRLPTPDYSDDVWNSAENYFRGRDFRAAAKAYRELLRQEVGGRAPMALIGLAESLEAENRLEPALVELRRCLTDYPAHPACFRVRVVGARILVEQGKWDEAKKLLLGNLEHLQLTPRSLEWRDSLFALGKLSHQEATADVAKSRLTLADSDSAANRQESDQALQHAHALFLETIRRLGEAVERYPDAPQRPEAQYLLADAYRQAARWPQRQLQSADIEATRVSLRDEAQQYLRGALDQYVGLRQVLSERERLTPVEAALLRNCYFAQGDAWFDLGDYKKAIDAYSTATNLYQSDPAALEAYVQIANCYRHLKRPIDARAMLEQASFVLQNSIPADAPFERTTRHSREEWVKLIEWLRTL